MASKPRRMRESGRLPHTWKMETSLKSQGKTRLGTLEVNGWLDKPDGDWIQLLQDVSG